MSSTESFSNSSSEYSSYTNSSSSFSSSTESSDLEDTQKTNLKLEGDI